jgi:SAM-dependent methyltransferase
VSWSEFLAGTNLFNNSIRLRYFIWTIQRLVPAGSKILEVGMGSGTTSVLLADAGYQVTAIDREPELVERIRERYSDFLRRGRLEVLQADMFALPWGDCRFDLAFHQGVLEHFQDEQIVAALREQRRVARMLLFDVPNHRYPERPYGDERLLSPSHWRRLIQQAGWHVNDVIGRDFNQFWFLLPHFLFTRRALEHAPWFSRNLGISSIFVCSSSNGKVG